MSAPADIPLTAELFARAIVAAAVSFGDHPLIIFESSVTRHKRALPAAALGVHLATGMQMDAAARIIGVSPSAISVNKRRDRPGFRRAAEAAREAVVYHLRGLELKAKPATVEVAVGSDVVVFEVAPPPASIAESEAPFAPLGEAVASPIIEEPPCEPVIRSAPRPAPSRPAPKAAAKPAQSSTRAMPKGARFVNLGEGVQRIEMKPIPERVARMAKAQLDKGADLAFVADCFDVDPDALQAAVASLTEGVAA